MCLPEQGRVGLAGGLEVGEGMAAEGAARCLSAGGEDWVGAWWAEEAGSVHGGGLVNQWCRLGVGHC